MDEIESMGVPPNPYRKSSSILKNEDTGKNVGEIEMSEFSIAAIDEPYEPMI